MFRFPQEGGTGAIWKKVAALLPAEKQQYNTKVVGIDAPSKTVTLGDGTQIQYNKVRALLLCVYFALISSFVFEDMINGIFDHGVILPVVKCIPHLFLHAQLISTIPLDIMLTWTGHAELAQQLTYSSSHIIGLGLRGQNPHDNKVSVCLQCCVENCVEVL